MRIGMLGPLEVLDDDGAPVYVAGARLRTLLIILALDPGRLVPAGQLVDGIWGDDPPTGAANALQALVSRLRRALPELAVESHPAGYRLALDPDAVDVSRFERLVAAARSAPSDEATADQLQAALELWRGQALLDVAESAFFQAPRTRLEELRLAATEDRVDAALRLGRGADLTTELTTLVAEYPLRERLIGQLMRALVAAGRAAEALAAYERTREALVDQLGTDPSPELSALHTSILRSELTPPPPFSPEPATVPARAGPLRPARTNLRTGLTSFIGRDADVARVRDLVGEYRLTTLTGSGGSGKTRLAGEASRALMNQMPDGVWLAELAPVANGADLPAAVLSALDLREQTFGSTGDDPTARLVAALRTRTVLLILDNCEHVIDAAAALADRLLGECPELRILATSREPLGITGEAVWPVEPLALPPEHDGAAGHLLGVDAVRLLVDRARAVRPGFTVTDADAPAVARICRALDGMPLAIELAAARLRTMTVEQLAARLDDRFRLLTGGSRTALPRHQTLWAVVDWSWELLSEPERIMLRRLAVFAGGATADAAARVCDVDDGTVLELLTALAEKSLLTVDAGGDEPRYRMLETIKAYGLERQDEAGERDTVRRAHIGWLIELAETAEPHLHRAEQLSWLRRLGAEHDDINAALRAAITAGDADNAIRLVAACGWYWWLGGHKTEGIELAIQALALPGSANREARATACAVVAYLVTSGVGDVRHAAGWVRQARELATGVEKPGPFLRFMAPLSAIIDPEAEPVADLMDTLAPLLEDPDPWLRAQARLTRAQMLGQEDRETDLTRALAEFRAVGERWGISYSLTMLADVYARRGELGRAIEHYEQAIVTVTEIGTVDDLVIMRSRLAQLRWQAGDRAGSAATIAQAERDAEQVAWPDGLAIMALHRAGLATWADDTVTARQQLARAEALMRHIPMDPVFRAIVLEMQAYLDAAEGRWDAAAAARAEALEAVLDNGEAETVGQVLVGIADHAVRLGHVADAVRLLAASAVIGGGLDRSSPGPVHVETGARAALGDTAYAEAFERAEREFTALDPEAARSLVRELAASVLGR